MAPVPVPQPLTEDQIAEFYREGYIVARGLVPATSIDKLLKEVKLPEWVKDGGNWSPIIFDHKQPTKDARLHRLLTEPSVIGAVEQIFEFPARVYFGMVAIVPARGGKGLPWHQDNQYGQIVNGALNVFIACCDITPDKAMLWVAPRSHLQGTLPSHASETLQGHREADVAPANGMPLDHLAKGDVVIFDRSTLHRSLKNDTDENRYAYAAQYQADNAREAATGRKDPTRMLASELRSQLLPLLD